MDGKMSIPQLCSRRDNEIPRLFSGTSISTDYGASGGIQDADSSHQTSQEYTDAMYADIASEDVAGRGSSKEHNRVYCIHCIN